MALIPMKLKGSNGDFNINVVETNADATLVEVTTDSILTTNDTVVKYSSDSYSKSKSASSNNAKELCSLDFKKTNERLETNKINNVELNLSDIIVFINTMIIYERIDQKGFGCNANVEYSATVYGQTFTAKGPNEHSVKKTLREKINKQLSSITENEFKENTKKFVFTDKRDSGNNGTCIHVCILTFDGKQFIGKSSVNKNTIKHATRKAIARALLAITHAKVVNQTLPDHTSPKKSCENTKDESSVSNIKEMSSKSVSPVIGCKSKENPTNFVDEATGSHINLRTALENPIRTQKFEEKVENSPSTSTQERAFLFNYLQNLDPHMKIFVNPDDQSKNFQFVAFIIFNGESFYGYGRNKNSATYAALQVAYTKAVNQSVASITLAHNVANTIHTESLSQELVDYIGYLVRQKYATFNLGFRKRNVVAGIVQTDGYSKSTTKLIAVATGTKCINGEYLNLNGEAVKDTHAEIVARRCLLLYFYHQLENIRKIGNCRTSIFEFQHSTAKYKLKSNVKFHLFISIVPCGDGAIFYQSGRTTNGQLRMKIESRDGSNPINSDQTLQTLDGIIQGTPLLTMSCSDKICKWNVVGVQGALLSTLIEPIYFDNIIIGSRFNEAALRRALYKRVESISNELSTPFKLNKPQINILTSVEERSALFAQDYSINWIVDFSSTEKIDSTTGKSENGISRLSTINLARRFITFKPNVHKDTYEKLKEAATEYQRAKELLFATFRIKGLNKWIKKPVELNEFKVF